MNLDTFDTSLFIDIIESIQGINFLRDEESEGISSRFYEGITGRLCIVDTTDEWLTKSDITGYTYLLGVPHIVDSLFTTETNCTDEEV